MRGRLLSLYLVLVGIAYLVVLFFNWTKPHDDDGFAPDSRPGLETLAFLSLPFALALVLWEILDVGGVRRTASSDSLVSFFFATLVAGIALAATIDLLLHDEIVRDVDLTLAAWIAVGFEVLLLVGGCLRLRNHIGVVGRRPAVKLLDE